MKNYLKIGMIQNLIQYASNFMENSTLTIAMSGSPLLTFLLMTFTGLLCISAFFPTDMLATKSSNNVLK